jgi:hypothetical protein
VALFFEARPITNFFLCIVAIDDFTGDGQSDILFRNDDGTIAVDYAIAEHHIDVV